MNAVKDALVQAIDALTQSGGDSPRLDAEVLLAHVLRQDRSWLYAHSEHTLSQTDSACFTDLILRRVAHEPVAHLTGLRDFYGLSFAVSPDVLIPRPETEILVELALHALPPGGLALDVGTGSGCIAVSIAVHAPQTRLIATDISAAALGIARQNARHHAVAGRIALAQADMLAGFTGPIDVIISNPPYIAIDEMATLAPAVRNFEPHLALTDGGSGLAHLARLLSAAPAIVRPNGWLFAEFGASQGDAVLAMAERLCPRAAFEIKRDLAGKDRVLAGYFSA